MKRNNPNTPFIPRDNAVAHSIKLCTDFFLADLARQYEQAEDKNSKITTARPQAPATITYIGIFLFNGHCLK